MKEQIDSKCGAKPSNGKQKYMDMEKGMPVKKG
jgi:hypothetical protein